MTMKHCITLLTLLLAPLAELHAADASVDERVYQHQRTPTRNATFSNDDPHECNAAMQKRRSRGWSAG